MQISQYIEERYLPWSRDCRADKTYRSHRNSANNVIKYFKETPISKIDVKALEDYLRERKKKLCARSTNIERAFLSSVFRRAIEERCYFKENPIKKIEQAKVQKSSKQAIKPEEMKKLWECATPWLRVILFFAIYSGMRPGEVCGLRWADIDWDREVIVNQMTKTYRENQVPINRPLKVLLLWLRDHFIDFRSMAITLRTKQQRGHVFCHRDGSPIKNYRFAFNKARVRAGLKHLTPHLTRHTFASQLLNKGIPATTLQALLGHTDIKTTMTYAHLDEQNKREATNQLDYSIDIKSLLAVSSISQNISQEDSGDLLHLLEKEKGH